MAETLLEPAQAEIINAALRSIEVQAERTAAALEKVLVLAKEIERVNTNDKT